MLTLKINHNNQSKLKLTVPTLRQLDALLYGLEVTMNIEDAVKTITNAIKKDPDLFYGYQSNIAMAFYDEYRRNPKKYKSLHDIHEIANEAAKHFLNLWSK